MSNVCLAKADASLEISLATKPYQASGCKGCCFAQTDFGPSTLDIGLSFGMRLVVNLDQFFHRDMSVDLRS
jgi:hypothetical protein